jgi:hypothetical protein
VNSNNPSCVKMLSFDVIFAAIIIVIYFSFIHSLFQVGLFDVCGMYYTLYIDRFCLCALAVLMLCESEIHSMY